MRCLGDFNLQTNELQNAVIPLDTYFPTGPKVGAIAFVNKILYICVDVTNNLPVWVPMTREITQYTHSQTSAATTWTVTHGLNTNNVQVQVFDSSNRMVIPDEIEILSNTQVAVSVSVAMTGKAVVLAGHVDGNTKPSYSYTHYQNSASTTWVIAHNLGYNPIVRVFIGNQEVQPASITFDNVNQVTITFNTAYVGYAKLL
jgi:hypothetical protein